MRIDKSRVRKERQQRAWSQEHLASVTGLGLRTIQRVESSGNGSAESASALASVLEVPLSELATIDTPSSSRRLWRKIIVWITLSCGVISAAIVGRVVLADPVKLGIEMAVNGSNVLGKTIDLQEGEPSKLDLSENTIAILTPENLGLLGKEEMILRVELYEIDSEGDSVLIGNPRLILEEDSNWELKIKGDSSNNDYRMVVSTRAEET